MDVESFEAATGEEERTLARRGGKQLNPMEARVSSPAARKSRWQSKTLELTNLVRKDATCSARLMETMF